jgi:hypothetical protein
MSWVDGTIYNGEWKNNQMHGVGYLRGGDGSFFQGDFRENKKHGEGTY